MSASIISPRFLRQPRAVALAALALAATLGTSAQAASLLLDPSDTNVAVGDSFAVTVRGTGFDTPIFGGGFNLAWDPTVLQLDGITLNTLNWNFAPSTGLLDAASGTVSDVSFNVFPSPIGGDFVVGKLNFTAIGAGVSALTTTGSSTLVFGDENAQVVNVTFVPGQVTVSGVVPEPSSLSLLLVGLLGIGVAQRQRRR